MSDSTSTQTQICLYCHAENAATEPVCQACYAPLSSAFPDAFTKSEQVIMWEDELGIMHPQVPPTWRDKARSYGSAALFLALFSSGWWRGKARWMVLGAGVAGVATAQWLHVRQNRALDLANRAAPPRQDDTGRLTDSLLRDCLQAGATQARITLPESGPLSIEFEFQGEWRQHAILQRQAWKGLHFEVCSRVHDNTIRITSFGVYLEITGTGGIGARTKVPLSPDEAQARFALRVSYQPPRGEIVLTLL